MANDRRKAGSKGGKGGGKAEAAGEAPSGGGAGGAGGARGANEPEAPIVPSGAGGASGPGGATGFGERGPGSSGSIDVQFSSPRLPIVGDGDARNDALTDALGEPTDVSRAPTTEASLSAHSAVERHDDEVFDPHDLTLEPEHTRSSARQVAKRAEVLLGQGVSKLGDGIGSIGEGVAKIGDRAKRVPVLGDSVKQLGEGLTELGASLHNLPAVTQSKRGRVLVRSMLVAFVLVFAWIAGIVLLQLRDSRKPDFRPLARKVLVAIRDGREAAVWAEASPRFQEVVREQRFIDDMADMKRTLGAFREIAAVNDTIVTTTSASGRIGRVALMLAFDKGRARANVSFHRDGGSWKLLGIAVDAPPELPITQESRKERSELPEEVMAAAIKVLAAGNVEEEVGDGRVPNAGAAPTPRDRNGRPQGRPAAAASPEAERERRNTEVWDQASGVFHSSASKEEFSRLQSERHQTLGNFVRVIEYRSGSKKFGDLSATFTGLVEYQSGVVSAALNFGRVEERAPWLLNSFKVVLPMPRPDEMRPGDVLDERDGDDGGERPRTGRSPVVRTPVERPPPVPPAPTEGSGAFTPPPYPPMKPAPTPPGAATPATSPMPTQQPMPTQPTTTTPQPPTTPQPTTATTPQPTIDAGPAPTSPSPPPSRP